MSFLNTMKKKMGHSGRRIVRFGLWHVLVRINDPITSFTGRQWSMIACRVQRGAGCEMRDA